MEPRTEEQLAQDYSAMGDSVALITAVIAGDLGSSLNSTPPASTFTVVPAHKDTPLAQPAPALS